MITWAQKPLPPGASVHRYHARWHSGRERRTEPLTIFSTALLRTAAAERSTATPHTRSHKSIHHGTHVRVARDFSSSLTRDQSPVTLRSRAGHVTVARRSRVRRLLLQRGVYEALSPAGGPRQTTCRASPQHLPHLVWSQLPRRRGLRQAQSARSQHLTHLFGRQVTRQTA